MGEIKKPIMAGIDSMRVSNDLNKLRSDVDVLNEFNSKIRAINKKLGIEVDGLKQLDAYLEEVTGFKNKIMAADSLNFKSQYMSLHDLTRPSIEPKLISILENGKVVISKEAKDVIRERYTSYVIPEFEDTARKMLEFKKWYDGLGYQEKHAFKQNERTSLTVLLGSLTRVQRGTR